MLLEAEGSVPAIILASLGSCCVSCVPWSISCEVCRSCAAAWFAERARRSAACFVQQSESHLRAALCSLATGGLVFACCLAVRVYLGCQHFGVRDVTATFSAQGKKVLASLHPALSKPRNATATFARHCHLECSSSGPGTGSRGPGPTGVDFFSLPCPEKCSYLACRHLSHYCCYWRLWLLAR